MTAKPRPRVARACAVVLLLCECKAPVPQPPALSQTIDSLSASAMRDGKVPGLAITIVRGDSVLYSKGHGFANLEQHIAMTDSTPVVIGSTSKTFTSFALMQLADSGRVALDSAVSHYVGMLKTHAARPVDARFAHITVRHLLTNVAGIPAGFSGEAYDHHDTSTHALESIVRDDMLTRQLDFDPGSSYRYSNRGFSLAALIVQDASGMSYEDYVAARIFEPLGMTRSTARFWEGPGRGMVQGYRESTEGKPLPRPASLGRAWTGSGMILSTSRDAGRFLSALLSQGKTTNGTQLLSGASVAEIERPQQKAESELGGPTMYGLGWEVSDMNGLKVVMKGGSVGSMGSLFVLIPDQKLGVAMLFNAIDYGKVQLLQNVVKTLLGAPASLYQSPPAATPVAPTGVRASPARLRRVAGTYDTKSGVMQLRVRGDTLAGRYEGNDVVLEPASDTSFVIRSVLREQEGTALSIKRCGRTTCLWMAGDSSGVRR